MCIMNSQPWGIDAEMTRTSTVDVDQNGKLVSLLRAGRCVDVDFQAIFGASATSIAAYRAKSAMS